MKKHKLYFALIPTAFSAVCGLTTVTSCNDHTPSGPIFDIAKDGTLTGFNHNWSKDDIAKKLAGTDTLVIPSNVKKIADKAFYNPNSSSFDMKTYTTIPDFIKTIDLSHVEKLESIGEYAFIASPAETIIFCNGIHFVHSGAFNHNYNLSCIDLVRCDMFPIEGWDVDAWNAFHSQSGVIKVKNVIGKEAWYQYFSINNNFRFSIEEWAIDVQLYRDIFAFNESNEISGLSESFLLASKTEQRQLLYETSWSRAELLIPTYSNGRVTGIAESAFLNSDGNESTIPDYVQQLSFEDGGDITIGKDAFKFAPFYSIALTKNVVNIQDGAFNGLDNLGYIDASCFADVPADWSKASGTWSTQSEYVGTINLKIDSTQHNEIVQYFKNAGIPSNWTANYKYDDIYENKAGLLLGYYSDFSQKEIFNLMSRDGDEAYVNIDKDVMAINNYAFYKNGESTIPSPAGAITTISLVFDNDSECDYIGEYAFAKSPISALSFPSTLKTIDNFAFHFNKGIKTITFPNGIEKIGNYSFDNCQSLESINIPSNLQILDRYAFWGCSKLNKIDMSSFSTLSSIPTGWSISNVFSGLPEQGTIYISATMDADEDAKALLESYLFLTSNEAITIDDGKWAFEVKS